MTVLANVSSRSYNPAGHTIPFSVDVNATRIETTFTHANTLAAWPSGPLLEYEVLWGGVSQGKSTIGGGVRNDKLGVPIVGNVVTGFGTNKPPGFTSGVVRVTVLKTLTTAVLVESF